MRCPKGFRGWRAKDCAARWKLAGNRFTAAFLGELSQFTPPIGGAASIIVIGFVNAGLLTLYQALGMLIGTD
jgi:phosphate:Na+ symporter